ncbi:hypothetical protein DFS33DRAFT_1337464 [Desarmillaria ectypa]|nr:hypothetical protein DFS33DRAFT_1337464 [Desarmillaria ectypa]
MYSQMLSLISNFSDLEVITTSRIRIDDPGGMEHIPVPSLQCAPSTLELNIGGASLECLFCPQSMISVGNLHVLNVVAFEHNILAITSLLSLSSSSLEHLTFLFEGYHEYSAGYYVDLRQLGHLQSICTGLRFDSYSLNYEDWSNPFPPIFKTLPSSVEDIFIEVGFRPYDAILIPQKQKEWQELDHILASYLWNFTVRLGIFVDYTLSDPVHKDDIYSQWPTCGDIEEYFRNFLVVDGMPEMNKLGCLNCEITKSDINFSTYMSGEW